MPSIPHQAPRPAECHLPRVLLLPRPVDFSNLPERSNILILAEAPDIFPYISMAPSANTSVCLDDFIRKLRQAVQRLRLNILSSSCRAEFPLTVREPEDDAVVFGDGRDLSGRGQYEPCFGLLGGEICTVASFSTTTACLPFPKVLV